VGIRPPKSDRTVHLEKGSCDFYPLWTIGLDLHFRFPKSIQFGTSR
jgi:hypothetical protein